MLINKILAFKYSITWELIFSIKIILADIYLYIFLAL